MALIALFAPMARSTNRPTPHHGGHRMPAIERYRRQRDLMPWAGRVHVDRLGTDLAGSHWPGFVLRPAAWPAGAPTRENRHGAGTVLLARDSASTRAGGGYCG